MRLLKQLENQKGVSMIMLVITIIMMAIIVSFAVFSSQNVAPEAQLASAYSSLKTIKDACDNALTLIEINPNEYDEYYFFGLNIQQNPRTVGNLHQYAIDCGLTSETEFSERTYIIENVDTEDSKRLLERLELKGVSSTYIVDLENEKYYIVKGAERVNGDVVYEYKDIMTSYEILTD